MDLDRAVAIQNLTDSSKKVSTIHNSVSELQAQMRDKSMDFYYKITLLSGGVLSLSITYIGYLSTDPNRQLYFSELLFISWVLLLIAIFSSIYRNHFNLNLGHYQTLNVLNKARLEEFKSSLYVLENYPEQFANLKTQEDINKQINLTKHNIQTVEKGIKHVNKSEAKNSRMWTIFQNSSHITFFLGMMLITLFASLNLPIPTRFTILELIK